MVDTKDLGLLSIRLRFCRRHLPSELVICKGQDSILGEHWIFFKFMIVAMRVQLKPSSPNRHAWKSENKAGFRDCQ